MLPGWPLVLRRELAAQYVGLSPSCFDIEWKAKRAPQPVSITPTVKGWRRFELEAWIDDLRAAETGENRPNAWDAA